MKPFQYHHTYPKEKVENKEFDSKLITRLLPYFRPYFWGLLFCLLMLITTRIIEAVIPIKMGIIAQKVLDVSKETVQKQLLFTEILQSCLAIFLLLATGYLVDLVNLFLRNWIGQNSVYKLRTEIFQHIQSLPIKFYDQQSVGRLMTRTIQDIEQIDQMLTESLIPILGNLFLFLFMFIGIFWVNSMLAIMMCCLIPILWLLASRFRKVQSLCYERMRGILSAMNGFLQEQIMGASTVRHFNLEKFERTKFEEINDDYRMSNLESIHNFAFFFASTEFLHQVMLIGSFALLVYFATPSEGFQAGTFFTFSLYALMLFRPIADLAERYNILQSALASTRRIFDILDQPSEKFHDRGKIVLEKISHISFENVWFAYQQENWVLKGISFEINQGDSIALVGTTGEGKTTIMNLLLRFYHVQKGKITINGRDIQEYTLASLRDRFSLVLQDPVIFSGTISDNITLYQPKITKERVESAVDYVHLRPFINQFPEGLQRVLAERGTGLSAGQLQLLSLARAVAHDGDLFLLDEATANIDVLTEKTIQETMLKILSQKTSLIIAHRLSTVRQATKILVINKGVIQESGTHQQLLAAKGIYEKLHRLQFNSAAE